MGQGDVGVVGDRSCGHTHPTAAVVLAFINGQPWDIVLLYGMAGIAYAYVIVGESVPIIEYLRRRLSKEPQVAIEFDSNCAGCAAAVLDDNGHLVRILRLGLVNRGRTTAEACAVKLRTLRGERNHNLPLEARLAVMHDHSAEGHPVDVHPSAPGAHAAH